MYYCIIVEFGYVIDEWGHSLVIGVELSVVEGFGLFDVGMLEVLS